MYELLSEIDVKAPIATVWAILADFSAYPKWTGAARITEESDDPSRLTYVIRISTKGSAKRPWAFPGQVTSSHPPETLRWTLGFPWLLMIEMQYALTRMTGVTHVRQVVQFKGVVPAIRKALFKRLFQSVMDATLRDLKLRAGQPTRPLVTATHARTHKKRRRHPPFRR